MTQNLPDKNAALSLGGKLRPVPGDRCVQIDPAAIGAALTAIREQLEVVRTLKSQLTSISNATKAVWTGLDSMRSTILARVAEAEAEIGGPTGKG